MSATDKRPTGFFIVDNEVVEVHGRDIGVYGVAVYAALAQQAGSKTRCCPSITYISQALNCSSRKVRDTLRQLEAAGLIATERRFGADKRQTSSEYVLLAVTKLDKYPAPPAQSAAPPARGAATPRHVVPPNKNEKEQDQETSFANAQEVAAPSAPQAARPGTTPAKRRPPSKPRQRPEPTAIQVLVDAFIEATGDTSTPYARNVRDAKALAEDGATADEVTGCVGWIMADPRRRAFFASEPFTLTTVRKYIKAYRTDRAPLAHVQACYAAVLAGLGLAEGDLTADVCGDYWQAARQAVISGAQPADVEGAIRKLAHSPRSDGLPASGRMIGQALAAVRSGARQAVAR